MPWSGPAMPRTAAPYVNFIFVIAGCEAFATSPALGGR